MVLHLNEQANNECWWWWICFACCAVLSQFSLLFNLSPLENLTFRWFFRLYIFTFCKLETVIYQIRGLLISGYWKLPKNNLVPFFGEAKNRHIQFPHAKHRFYFRFHIRGLSMKLCILSVSESNVEYCCVSKRLLCRELYWSINALFSLKSCQVPRILLYCNYHYLQ